MRLIVMLAIAGLLSGNPARATVRGERGATPGVTSLLTAERRAREAAERLELPATRPARWKRGGGWTPAWTVEPRPRRPPAE
ncbi:MAG TPA: hypothetical protein VNO26_07290 [Candidatus Limnocylindria bacterium]|nr:hypothetical protein [Candidatus Limnocylindria bacterium]